MVETSRGTFAFETYPDDAPATVAHVVALVKAGFYDGSESTGRCPGSSCSSAIRRPAIPPPATVGQRRSGRQRQAGWRRRDHEAKRLHRKGAVGMAHMGNPARADSQIYVTLDRRPDLDGRYAVFGQVVAGEEVPARLQVGDEILKVCDQGVG